MKYCYVLLLILLTGCASKRMLTNPDKIEVQKIWNEAPHSAFTDLIRFKGKFYCTFREAQSHVSGPKGNARIIMSPDGKNWQSMASFKIDGLDLRDPKISITPDNRLMVLIDVETWKDGKVDTRKPYISLSDKNGENFSQPAPSTVDPKIAVKFDWVWRVTWHNGVGYAIDYQPGIQSGVRTGTIYLLKTIDGKSFLNVSKLNVEGYPNESTIRFDKHNKMYVLIRRDAGDKRGVIATTDAPYTNWQYHKMELQLGGPNFIFLNDSTLCIGSRYYTADMPEATRSKKNMTAIFITDLNGKAKKIIPIKESGGDCSYPGMLVYKNRLWYSYYSSHEDKTSIYLAKVPLNMLTK